MKITEKKLYALFFFVVCVFKQVCNTSLIYFRETTGQSASAANNQSTAAAANGAAENAASEDTATAATAPSAAADQQADSAAQNG